MANHRKFTDLTKDWSPARRARVKEVGAQVERELRLAEIRRLRGLTQVTLAETLDISQSDVSKLEHRTDLYLSTLRRFVEATGGDLILQVRWPDGESVRVALDDPLEASTR